MENRKSLTFFLSENEGEFVAFNKTEPCFCFVAKDRKSAIDTALRAWNFYLDAVGQHTVATVERSVPVKNYRRNVVPQELIYAVA